MTACLSLKMNMFAKRCYSNLNWEIMRFSCIPRCIPVRVKLTIAGGLFLLYEFASDQQSSLELQVNRDSMQMNKFKFFWVAMVLLIWKLKMIKAADSVQNRVKKVMLHSYLSPKLKTDLFSPSPHPLNPSSPFIRPPRPLLFGEVSWVKKSFQFRWELS